MDPTAIAFLVVMGAVVGVAMTAITWGLVLEARSNRLRRDTEVRRLGVTLGA